MQKTVLKWRIGHRLTKFNQKSKIDPIMDSVNVSDDS